MDKDRIIALDPRSLATAIAVEAFAAGRGHDILVKASDAHSIELQATEAVERLAHIGGPTKLYSHHQIKRYLDQHKPDYAAKAKGSQADQPHTQSREIARRQRQEARAAAKRAAKAK